MSIETLGPPDNHQPNRDVDVLMAAACLPLPEAVIGLLMGQADREGDDLPAGWSALDSFGVAAIAVLAGAVMLAALVKASVS